MKKTIKTAQWDATVDSDICDPYTNADVTLELRLGFKEINPASGASGTYNDYGDPTEPARKIIKWTPGAWKKWTGDFISSAQKYWDGRFWLVNNFALLEYSTAGATYRPNLWCRLKIVHVPTAAIKTAHHVIDVVRLHSSETWFGSHSTLYDNLDTKPTVKDKDKKGSPIVQRAHVHEVGHLLGLAHVAVGNAACPATGDTNAAACYGVSDEDKKSVMGEGMALRRIFANPWRRAMVQLTGQGNAGSATDWQPKLQRHYPRTAAEVVGNRAIIARPVR